MGGGDTGVEQAVKAKDSRPTASLDGLLRPSAEAMGFDLVQLRLMGSSKQRTLRVMAERLDGGDMTIDHCAELSRAISAILDVDDPIQGAYLLEVGSPGIDRPLVRPGDYQRFAGHEAKIELGRMIAGQRRFRGRVLGLSGDLVRLAVATGQGGEKVVELPFDEIVEAKLVMTDALIAEVLKKRKTES